MQTMIQGGSFMHQRTRFVLSAPRMNESRSGMLWGMTGIAIAMGITFWPGVGSSSLVAGRSAKSVSWYAGNIDEARAMSRACLASDDLSRIQESSDCRNSLRALNLNLSM
jgi:hypothetical protein